MAPTITCHPPLGSIHVLDPDVSLVRFVVGIPSSDAELPNLNGVAIVDVSVWHNCTPTQEWSELGLTETTALPLLYNRPDRRYFTGVITLAETPQSKGLSKFTVKFRTNKDASWLWIRDVDGSEDGELVLPTRHPPSSSLSSYLHGASNDILVHEQAATALATHTAWEIRKRIPAAQGRASGRASCSLGKAVECIRWFAIVRHADAWFGPRHGREVFSLKEEGVMLSFLRRDGLHVTVVAVSGIEDVSTTMVSGKDGDIVICSRNEGPNSVDACVFVAVAKTCQEAIAGTMSLVRDFVRSHRNSFVDEDLQEAVLQNTDEATRLQDWYDGFAYCTWNGLGQYLSPSKIFDALTNLHERGVRLSSLIIDDNWQSVQLEPGKSDFYRQWYDFEANKEHFPGGLKELVTNIRSRFPYIQFIAVWHGIFGHWGGIAPDGNIAKAYTTRTFMRREGIFLGGGTLTAVEGADAERLYDDFYRFLAGAGVDGVKVDTQSFLDYPEHANDRLALTTAYQNAWRLASLKYFGGRAIACMAQIPQTVFYSFLRDDLPKPMVRVSDDFFPDDPSSHSWHVFCNAHNALLMQHFSLLPDWDMFQTSHQFSRFHAAARCVSGGPIYITDVPGEHDIDLIEQMTAKVPNGRLVVLRTEQLGRTVEMYSGHSEAQFLQISAKHQEAVVTAIFNLLGEPRRKLISLGCLHPNPVDETLYLFRVHSSGRVFRHDASSQDAELAIMELHLEGHDCDIITKYPVHRFQKTDVAVLGLLGKMAAAAAVLSATYTVLQETSEMQVEIHLRALGMLGVYVLANGRPLSSPVKLSIGDGAMPEVKPFIAADPFVLAFDLETMWNSSDRNHRIHCGDGRAQVIVTLMFPQA
ncbi:raffinose synthase or seed imbibition protein Sip1-domain-containing protein [Apiosordaria backusii]|uniref:Raffinose synthase or seed imbibition protein Sip1-domain-containing protein n=1 Tax=Apiosordaria backusii TaxID=314023 RepID=A0AA40EI89_9PEZI|nr:raffinose synthase or seed imbibition protein Sip1-domain-containing protein [Apiosordaria backusii]